MKIRNILKSLYALGLTCVLCGCSIDKPPLDLYSDPDAISSVQTARSLLTSCYILYPHYEMEISQLGNDFCLTDVSCKDVEQQNFYSWQDLNISRFASDSWLGYYNCIASLDVLEKRLPNVKVDGVSDSLELKVVTAECKTLKAMCYFDLLRLFSSAYDNETDSLGIILKSECGIEMKGRATKQECVRYIHELLDYAVGVDNVPTSNGWLSKKAAQYMLAELALYTGDYKEAIRYSESLIEVCDSNWISATNYSRLWSTSSYEGRIFAFYTSNAVYAGLKYSDAEGDYFALNPDLSFAEGDARGRWTAYECEIKGNTRILFGKYNKVNREDGVNIYIQRMRYSGAYFMAGESYARLGEPANAIRLVNYYLTAVGADTLTYSEGRDDELIDAILREKYKEFAGEGQNYYDLKRTHRGSLNKYGVWGSYVKTTISTSDYRWTFPIPPSEYRYNVEMKQNEGWRE
ncbi:MAG: RagB/SusD family nutrient uptake outer membrane protein [Bacteroidaceae bacterium]|nr:RagB/SusD family nutrient uptake outer membrane protein [Bacteroidaceae bacterium]